MLLNQSHSDQDLVLSIDEAELPLFRAIDGRRTIAAIVERAQTTDNPASRERARDLFERLWWYDQVVFDASGH